MLDPTFRKRRRSITARLGRVIRALERLDEYEAAQAMPPDIRPNAKKPALGRRALSALRTRLLEDLAELDATWEPRN